MTPTPDVFSRLNLYTVLHNLPDGVTLANAEGRIVFSNAAADQILGVTAAVEASPDEWAEHYGVFLPDGQTPFPTGQYPLVRALKGEIAKDVEMVIRNATHPDGVLISASGRRLFDADGTPIGAVVVFRDITALRRAENELHGANERLRRTQAHKDEILAYVVHDLKSPLTAITATADLVLAGEPLSPQTEEDVRTIREAAARINAMVMDLLDVQLAEDGALELNRAQVSLDRLLHTVRREARGRLAGDVGRLVVGEGVGLRADVDPSLLLRLVLNLVDNCVKYGPDDGTIWIDAAPGRDDTVLISVRDEGPGVPDHLRDRIFEKYARLERDEGRRSEDSRGLGLRFCKVVAEAHGGRIWVEDAERGGARFCVELPLHH